MYAAALCDVCTDGQMRSTFERIGDESDEAARAHLHEGAESVRIHVLDEFAKAHGAQQMLHGQLLFFGDCRRKLAARGGRPQRHGRFVQRRVTEEFPIAVHVWSKQRRVKAGRERQHLREDSLLSEALEGCLDVRLAAAEDGLMRTLGLSGTG